MTTATVTPPPNAAGWNRTDVTVTLAATDDISGVARTEYVLDSVPATEATAPIPIVAEGVHTMQYHSVDRSQNVETAKWLVVSIDRTAPEAVITYDPVTHSIDVAGRDALSGVAPGPIGPSSIVPTTWTEFGSDCAEIRTYRIFDRADNSLELTLKIKIEPDEFEMSVTRLCYDEVSDRNDANRGAESRRLQRNTIEFERIVGRGLDRPLLAVEQEVSLGEDGARTTTSATYDVLHDESEIEHRVGGCASERTSDDGGDPEVRGLSLLRVVTDRGRLILEE